MTTRTASALLTPVSVQQLDARVLLSWLERICGKLDAFESKLEALHSLLSARRKDFYTVEETAGVFGRSTFTIRRWVSEGKLQATRVSGTGPRGRLLVARTELERLIAAGRGADVPEAAIY